MNLDRWLEGIGLAQYAELFRSNEIDHSLLRQLSNDDLREMGVAALGHRKKLLAAIADLQAAPLGSPLSPVTTPGGEPRRHTPKHFAEKILLSKSALEGERKQITVLFADIKGSLELLADRDPEDGIVVAHGEGQVFPSTGCERCERQQMVCSGSVSQRGSLAPVAS